MVEAVEAVEVVEAVEAVEAVTVVKAVTVMVTVEVVAEAAAPPTWFGPTRLRIACCGWSPAS